MSQEQAAASMQREFDFHWGRFRRDVEAIRSSAIAEAKQHNATSAPWRNPNEAFRDAQMSFVMRCFAMIDNLSQHVRGGTAWDDNYRYCTKKLRSKAAKGGNQQPSYPSAQTYRMVRFIQHYLSVDPTAARLGIEIYRHVAMHRGSLQPLVDNQDRYYDWYLGWDADAKDHFRVRRAILGVTPDVKEAVETILAGGSLGDHEPGAYQAKALIADFGQDILNSGWGVEIGTMTLGDDVERAAHRYIANLRHDTGLYTAFLRLREERANEKLRWTPDLP